MKKNKGFTLIELLAVLVILAIIALIITPIVANLIKDARIRSAEDATEGLLEAVHVYYGRQIMVGNGVFNNNQTQTVEFDGAPGGNSTGTVDGDTAIEFNGFKITGGSLTIDRYGNVQIKNNDQLVVNGYYCINKDGRARCNEEVVEVAQSAADMLIANAVTSGDGLYADPNTSGKYVYKGANPANYIEFNGETWRIMSVEPTGEIKIIKDQFINLDGYVGSYEATTGESCPECNHFGVFDIETSPRRGVGYCSNCDSGSCNAWAKKSNFKNSVDDIEELVGENVDIVGEVTEDASINTYLNTTYKNSLSSAANYIAPNMTWNIGPAGFDLFMMLPNVLEIDSSYIANYEKKETWNGDIALATLSEFLDANSNSSCTTMVGFIEGYDTCKPTNYLHQLDSRWFLLTPNAGDSIEVMLVFPQGFVDDQEADSWNTIRPALYLKSNIKIEGNGTNDSNIYKIVGLN